MTSGPPQLLGERYELGPVLGYGGMARVHRATDTVLGREVAVKVFRVDIDAHDAARVQNETSTLASLSHPGLVEVYDAGTFDMDESGPTPYLVMELVDGPTLANCCVDGSLTPEQVAAIGADLAAALAHVHDRGIVHRDVKPANVLLADVARAKLTDFGIARIVDGARHTQTGLLVGTAPYLSPEQVQGLAVGPPSDVYSLGLVLLEALTGHREYDGQGVESALARLRRQPVVPATLPAPWPGLLTAMTAQDPAGRPTAHHVGVALAAAAGGEPTQFAMAPTAVLPATDPATAALPVQRRGAAVPLAARAVGNRVVLGIVGGVLALCALVAGLAAHSRNSSEFPGTAPVDAAVSSSPSPGPAASRAPAVAPVSKSTVPARHGKRGKHGK